MSASTSPDNQRSADPSLRERISEERIRTIADAIPQLIWTNDGQGEANWFNARWYEYTGLTRDESEGPGWQRVVHPDDAPASKSRWVDALAKGHMFDTEYRLRHAAGVYRWFIGRNVPLKGPDGRVQAWFGTATDIDDLKRAQEAARRSETWLRVTRESATDFAIITLNADGIIEGWSSGAERTFGYRESEVIGKPTDLIFTPEDRAIGAAQREQQQALRDGRAEDERWHLRRDGTRVFMSGVLTPIYDPELTGFVKVARDITERRRNEIALRDSEARYRAMSEDLSRTREALLTADRRKDDFIATLAHELRNPLAPIRSAVQLVQMSNPTDPETLWALGVLTRQMKAMTRLIDDLMDVSRISQNKLQLRCQPVPIADTLQDAIEASEPQIAQQRQRLSVSLPPATVLVDGDQTRLSQVFANLLDNASKYTETGGEIGVEVTVLEDTVDIAIRDNGIGIAPEHVSRIFELFSQLHTSIDRARGGLGIGLALVQHLVQMHGGTITVQSGGLGRGSEFIVRLPLLRDVVRAPGDGRPLSHVISGRRILIADDNVDAADAFRVLFAREGNTVEVVYDGISAIRVADQFQPDLLLLDIGLPKFTGLDIAAHVRAQPWGADAIMIAISGWGTAEDLARSAEAGFDRHLVKPVDPAELMAVIAEATKGKRET